MFIFGVKVKRFILNEDLSQSSIYHYTDLSSLESILNSGCLYFTHFKSLNDSSEIDAAIDVFLNFLDLSLNLTMCNIVTRRSAEYLEKMVDDFKNGKYNPCDAEYDFYKDFIKRSKVCDYLIQSIKNDESILINNTDFFISSFCLNPDSLPMWINYAKLSNSQAINISFDYKKLTNSFLNNLQNIDADISCGKVMYSDFSNSEDKAEFLYSLSSKFLFNVQEDTIKNFNVNDIDNICSFVKLKFFKFE